MRKNRFFNLSLLLITALFVQESLAQTTLGDQHLPEGAKARLGKGSIRKIAYSLDGTRLAVESSIGIWIYDAQTGEDLSLLPGHTNRITSVSFSPDGQILASWSYDNTISLWDVDTGRLIRTLTGHTDDVTSVSFSPDGQILASGVMTGPSVYGMWAQADLFAPSQELSGRLVQMVRFWQAGVMTIPSVYGCGHRQTYSHPHRAYG